MVKKELFSQLNELLQGEVNFGNKFKVSIMNKSNVKICFKDGTMLLQQMYFLFQIFLGIFWACDN